MKTPPQLRQTIAANIRECRLKNYPGHGGAKQCAEAFGVSPQQWSPWERGMRTPDELRLSQIADFFDVSVEYLRRDNAVKPPVPQFQHEMQPQQYAMMHESHQPNHPTLREPDAPPYGLPSLRREDNLMSMNSIAELSQISGRLLAMVSSTTKGVVEGRFDANKTAIVLRRLGDILEHKLREAENQSGNILPPSGY